MELANFNKSNTQNETNTYLRSLQFTIYNIIAMHNLAVPQFTMRDYTRNFTHVVQTSILFNIASTFMNLFVAITEYIHQMCNTIYEYLRRTYSDL